MLTAFRRKPEPNAARKAAGEPAPPPVEAVPAAPAHRLDTEMVDALEADVLASIRAVSGAITATSAGVAAARDDLGHVHLHMTELVSAGRAAASQTGALAASTEELAATSGEITGAMDQANERIGRAVASAHDANALIAELSRATEEIVGIVETIAAVARQTNLLALNATIEAARAGVAGRGFAVVASEVKALSVETGNAASDIRARIEHLRNSAGSSMAAVETAKAVIQGVQPVFATVRTAVEEQSASVAELAQRATEASAYVERVSERAQEIDAAARDAAERMSRAGDAAAGADALAQGLGQRFVAVMRQSEIGDRRQHDRFPADLGVTIRAGGREIASRSVDIGQGGLLVAKWDKASPAVGSRLDLTLERAGPLSVRVAAVSAAGIHCSLDGITAEARERVVRIVAEIEAEYRPLIEAARGGARRIEAALEQAVAAGRLTRDQLFDTRYRPIPGTDPQQYETAYAAVLDDVLPAIQEPLLVSDNSMVFCIAADRNGYVPVHNRRYAQPQRAGDPVWNAANCRNKRIFDDRAGITAARSTRPFVIQTYARDMGGGRTVMMREIDAPIRLFGRHWGGFRTAYRL